MYKIVVTGATSFIGVHLIEKLLSRQWEVYGVVRPKSANISRLPKHGKLHIVELEMSELSKLPQLLKRADGFYHLAWEGARLPYRDDPILQKKNYEAAVTAIEAACRLGCSCFIGAGSQAEYGPFNGAITESDACCPVTEYGKEKYHAYQTLQAIAKEKGIKFIWPRIFSIYGRYDYQGTLIMTCLDKMSRNEPMEMTACTQMWDYLHVEDAAEAMIRFFTEPCESGVYHIASGDAKPLKLFVEEIKAILGSESQIHYGAIPYGKNGPVNLEPKVYKIQQALQWKNEISFEDGIRKMLPRKG